MAVSGKIEIIEPGSGKKTFFSESGDIESDLIDAVENVANPGSVVVLNPGDYTSVGTVNIPSEVSVVLMPGATVSYASSFRTNGNFGISGDPTSNSNHPLNTGSSNTIERYSAPDFTGAVENVVDLNFGSEWAFETDLEELRSTVEGELVGGEFFWFVESGDLSGDFGVPDDLENASEIVEFSVPDVDGEVTDAAFVERGERLYATDSSGFVIQLSLGSSYDLTTASLEDEFDTSNEISSPQDVVVQRGGGRMWVAGNGSVQQYDLDDFDVTTASPSGSLDVSSETSNPTGIAFDRFFGTLVVSGNGDQLFQYGVETNADLSGNVVFDGSFSDSDLSQLSSLDFVNSGIGVLVSDAGNGSVVQYGLGDRFDATSVEFTNRNETLPSSIGQVSGALGEDKKLFVVDSDDNNILPFEADTQERFDSTISVSEISNGSMTRTLRFEDTIGNKFNLTEGDPDLDNTDEITVRVENDGVLSVSTGRLLQLGNGGSETGDVLVFHRDVAVDSAGFGELGESVTNGVRIVSDLEINKSEPPTGGGGTFDGHVKRVGAVDLVGGSNIDITENSQPNGPDEFEISVSGGTGSDGVTVTDPENDRSFGEITTLQFAEGLDVISPVSSGARIDHGDTGTNFDFDPAENVVATDDAGHVQEAATVGLSSSLQIDSNAGTLEHDVSPVPDDNTGSPDTFLHTIEFDDNGHVTRAEFSTANGGGGGEDPEKFLNDSEWSTTNDTLTFKFNDNTEFDQTVEPNKLYRDRNNSIQASIRASNQGAIFFNPSAGINAEGKLAINSGDSNFVFNPQILLTDTNNGDNADVVLSATSGDARVKSDNTVFVSGEDEVSITSNQGNISFNPNDRVSMNAAAGVEIIGDFEFRDGYLAMEPRNTDINPGTDLDSGTAAIYALVVGTNNFGEITDIDLRWAENLEDGGTRLNDLDGS